MLLTLKNAEKQTKQSLASGGFHLQPLKWQMKKWNVYTYFAP
jgi:hypothetical protein